MNLTDTKNTLFRYREFWNVYKKRWTRTKNLLLISGLVFLIVGSVLWFTAKINIIPSFAIDIFRLIIIIFRGDENNGLHRVKGPRGINRPDKLYLNIIGSCKLIRDRIKNTDWLLWSMLFIPFYATYVTIQESFLKLRRNIRYLKDDCSLKSNFITWQSSMHVAMHQRIAELRIEVKTLNQVLNGYRQYAKENDLMSDTPPMRMRKPVENIDNDQNNDLSIIDKTQLTARKNKSDSVIEEMREPDNSVKSQQVRPKTEEGKSTRSIQNANKSDMSPVYAEARKRLQKRSKDVLKTRLDSVRKAREELNKMKTPDEVQEEPKEEKKSGLQRSKFTARGTREEKKTSLTSDICKALKADNLDDLAITATDLLHVPQEQTKMKQYKRRSYSDSEQKSITSHTLGEKMADSSQSIMQNIHENLNRDHGDELVANLEFQGLGRVTSYTEIFKKKVHVPKSGKGPEITIEGKRRWYF